MRVTSRSLASMRPTTSFIGSRSLNCTGITWKRPAISGGTCTTLAGAAGVFAGGWHAASPSSNKETAATRNAGADWEH